jgi:hypothetical protein
MRFLNKNLCTFDHNGRNYPRQSGNPDAGQTYRRCHGEHVDGRSKLCGKIPGRNARISTMITVGHTGFFPWGILTFTTSCL